MPSQLLLFLLFSPTPTLSFYLIALNHLRTPWSRLTPSTNLPNPMKYASRGTCYPIPITYAPVGDYIEALGIYNIPYEEGVRAIGFWDTPTCDSPIRTGNTGPSPSGNGMRVRPKSFRSLAPFQEVNKPNGYLSGEKVEVEKTTVISMKAPSMIGNFIPRKWEIDTWFTEAPWWLPEVNQQYIYRYIRDWIEMALQRQAGIHPMNIWGVYNDMSRSVPAEIADVLEENAARQGRELSKLYTNPVIPRNLVKTPDFLERVEWRRQQLEEGVVARNARGMGFGFRMFRNDLVEDELGDGPSYEESTNYGLGDLQVSDMELADQEAALYEQSQSQPQSLNLLPEDQVINQPVDIEQPRQIPSYDFTNEELPDLMNTRDPQIAIDQEKTEAEKGVPPPFWLQNDPDFTLSPPNDLSFLDLEPENEDTSLKNPVANPDPYAQFNEIDFYDPESMVVGGRIPPEVNRVLQNTGVPRISRSELENLQFEELDPFTRALEEAERDYARENADTDISNSPGNSSRVINSGNNEIQEPINSWRPSGGEQSQPAIDQNRNKENPPPNLNQIIAQIPNSHPSIKIFGTGTQGPSIESNFGFRNFLEPSQVDNASTLKQGVLQNEALLRSLSSCDTRPTLQQVDEGNGPEVPNEGPQEYQEEDEGDPLEIVNQLKKKRKTSR
ncbi:hypothetical protein TWF506_003241 [Arthrobotrys conoides]|uniref:Uncharacterized protein n=1 Tax=Arthrobotrys conoides TaxID=74498 RepID=A0AAN8RL12_9PEZI